jgi:hypothetical protein
LICMRNSKNRQVYVNAGSIMKCNTWRSGKGTGTLSGYGKTIQAFEHR